MLIRPISDPPPPAGVPKLGHYCTVCAGREAALALDVQVHLDTQASPLAVLNVRQVALHSFTVSLCTYGAALERARSPPFSNRCRHEINGDTESREPHVLSLPADNSAHGKCPLNQGPRGQSRPTAPAGIHLLSRDNGGTS